MQEESLEKTAGMDGMSVEELFLGAQETYEEAQLRAREENRAFARTEFFRMDKPGVYRLRILPLAPNRDGAPGRPGYEHPVHQLLLELEKPEKGGKTSKMYVTVPRATDAGYSLDVIDTYRRMAVNAAEEAGDNQLAEKIDGGSFGGGLKFSYGHCMYVLNLDERAKGLQLLTLSHAQFKDLDERKFRLWQKKLAKNPHYPCPVSSVYNAYPVEIEKRKNGAKTEYVISIDNEAESDSLTREEMAALMAAPRIPEIVHRYTRYHLGATVEFLRQCDRLYGFSLMDTDDMRAAIDTLEGELPAEDKSAFSFDRRTKENRDNARDGAVSLDELFSRHEELQQEGLGDKTEEGQQLRTMIREYIRQEGLAVRVTRSTSNKELLEMIEEEMEGPKPEDAADSDNDTEETAEEERPRRRR